LLCSGLRIPTSTFLLSISISSALSLLITPPKGATVINILLK